MKKDTEKDVKEIYPGENMKWLRAVTVLPAKVRHNPELSPLEKLIYSELLGLASYNSTVFIAIELRKDLAALYGVSLTTVTKAIRHLEKMQLIVKVDDKDDYYMI